MFVLKSAPFKCGSQSCPTIEATLDWCVADETYVPPLSHNQVEVLNMIHKAFLRYESLLDHYQKIQ